MLSQDGVHYRWQDGSTVTLNRWAKDLQEDEDCVFIDVDGTWKTKSCDDQLPGAICHVPTSKILFYFLFFFVTQIISKIACLFFPRTPFYSALMYRSEDIV